MGKLKQRKQGHDGDRNGTPNRDEQPEDPPPKQTDWDQATVFVSKHLLAVFGFILILTVFLYPLLNTKNISDLADQDSLDDGDNEIVWQPMMDLDDIGHIKNPKQVPRDSANSNPSSQENANQQNLQQKSEMSEKNMDSVAKHDMENEPVVNREVETPKVKPTQHQKPSPKTEPNANVHKSKPAKPLDKPHKLKHSKETDLTEEEEKDSQNIPNDKKEESINLKSVPVKDIPKTSSVDEQKEDEKPKSIKPKEAIKLEPVNEKNIPQKTENANEKKLNLANEKKGEKQTEANNGKKTEKIEQTQYKNGAKLEDKANEKNDNIPQKNKAKIGNKETRTVLKTVNPTEELKKAKQTKAPVKKPGDTQQNLPDEVKNYKPTILKTFTPKKIFADGRRIPPIELLHQKPNNSTVRVYLFEEFLSVDECDQLRRVHDKHVTETSNTDDPIVCFDSINTLRKHLKSAKKKIKVTPKVFTRGTTCLNASFSKDFKTFIKGNWSYSTAFYPGESRFSKIFAARVQQATGLTDANGGKFQITSYPTGIGYKKHTDCTVGAQDKRDRFATILVYLDDVEEGGETKFPDLGIWVRPKKGRALVWTNMDEKGECDPLSVHDAAVVKKGKKYILQRWYYYESFYSLGKRPPEPELPVRKQFQPRVSCDEYDHGSCRWYDEWNYDHLLEYQGMKHTLI